MKNNPNEDELMDRYVNTLEGWKGHWILQHHPKPIDTDNCKSCRMYSSIIDHLTKQIEAIPHHGAIPPKDVQDG